MSRIFDKSNQPITRSLMNFQKLNHLIRVHRYQRYRALGNGLRNHSRHHQNPRADPLWKLWGLKFTPNNLKLGRKSMTSEHTKGLFLTLQDNRQDHLPS